jgi:hypothetical protein
MGYNGNGYSNGDGYGNGDRTRDFLSQPDPYSPPAATTPSPTWNI